MRQLLFVTLLFSCACSMLNAQKHDNNWLWGKRLAYQDSLQYWAGNAQGNFDTGAMYRFAKFRNMPFKEGMGWFSNEEGELLFYSNGMQIRDTTGNLIEGGDSINHDLQWDQAYPGMIAGDGGIVNPRGIIFLATPGYDSLVYMVHEHPKYPNMTDARVKLTKIKRKPDGSFAVIEKNKVVTNTPPAWATLAACRHGNGRDWWIFFTEYNTNCVNKLLLANDTLIEYGVQCIGDTVTVNSYKSCFSPDGTKYGNTDAVVGNGTNIFDFDRCSGELSNAKNIPIVYAYDTINGTPQLIGRTWSFEFSPDGSMLYLLVNPPIVIQYQLNDPNFPNNGDTIGYVDGIPDSAVNPIFPFTVDQATYGPDGRIYITSGQSTRFMCTINNPGGIGASCDFRSKNIFLPKYWVLQSPNIPNYRLGRMVGSTCDTIYSDIKPLYTETPWLKVFPNPATDIVRLDYNWIEWDKLSDCELQIADLEGRIVYKQKLPKYSSKQDMDISQLAQGIYTAHITATMRTGEQKKLATTKLVRQE